MTTYTAFTTVDGQADAEALGELLELLNPEPTGVGVFEIEDGSGTFEIGAYFVEKPDEAGLALLTTLRNAKPFVVSKLDDRDWVAQVRRELTPVQAGRFVVFGAHDADNVPTEKIHLLIEAAMAFGTGHHDTTRGCLLSLEHLIKAGFRPNTVADIGAGTGVLAMAAAKAWPVRAIASDIDPIATETAKANARSNTLAHRIRCITSVGFRHEALRTGAPFDLVFANILARPLRGLACDMARFTQSGSFVILSGLLTKQAPGVLATYLGHGFALERRVVLGEWTTLTLRRVYKKAARSV